MKNIQIPYGTGHLRLAIEEQYVNEILTSKAHEYKAARPQEELVRAALSEPVSSKHLSDMTANAGKVLVITSDHTRPVPSKITLPILLEEIRRKNPADKTTGYHSRSMGSTDTCPDSDKE